MSDWYKTHDEWEQVLEAYGFTPRAVERRGGVYKIRCRDGVYALKPSNASYEKLTLLNEMLESARENGFRHLLPWVRAKNGECVVKTRQGCWYATPWKEKEQPEVNNASPVKWVHALASFHKLMESVVEPWPELKTQVSTSSLDHWKEQKAFLDEARQSWTDQEFPSPFVKSFLSLQEALDRSLSFAIQGMERFVKSEEGMAPRYTLCHRRLHAHNVVQDEGDFYFIDFDHAEVDSPVRDLAVAIRRWGHLSPDEGPHVLLETYESQHPLKPKEKKLLALYLSYPEQILKTVGQYRNRISVAEAESSAVQRLEEERRRFNRLQELTKSLWRSERRNVEEKGTAQVRAERSGKKRKKTRSPKA